MLAVKYGEVFAAALPAGKGLAQGSRIRYGEVSARQIIEYLGVIDSDFNDPKMCGAPEGHDPKRDAEIGSIEIVRNQERQFRGLDAKVNGNDGAQALAITPIDVDGKPGYRITPRRYYSNSGRRYHAMDIKIIQEVDGSWQGTRRNGVAYPTDIDPSIVNRFVTAIDGIRGVVEQYRPGPQPSAAGYTHS